MRARLSLALDRLHDPVDPASLGLFRAGFGAILLVEICRYFGLGWIREYYLEPAFHFTYPGFDWVRPWPGIGLYLHFLVLGLAALGIALGVASRLSAAIFFLGFSYVFLLEQARYLNHFYLVVLLSGILACVPADLAFSIDAWRRRERRAAPAWALALLRTQIGLVYFYAGVAKLNADWLRGEPLGLWLAARRGIPVLGPLLSLDWMPLLFSYGGLLLDLLAWPLLGWKRTRPYAFAVVLLFHLTNASVFDIGIFPWLMIAATTLFFDPSWPRRWLGLAPIPLAALPPPTPARRRRVAVTLAAYLSLQILIPIRHFLYPGSVHWTEEGHNFSWHMKLRSKRTGATFLVTDVEAGKSVLVDPRGELTPWQLRKMGGTPDMILLYAHHLADRFRRKGHGPIEVRATAMVSLNGREPRLLVDPSVDLAAQRRSLAPASWIVRE